MGHAVPWFTSPERYHDTTKAVIHKLQAQNVHYLETSFHIGILEIIGVHGEEIIDAIKSAVPKDFTLRLFMGMVRNSYQGVGRKIIDDFPNWSALDGVDLHGPEDLPLEEWTERAWTEARQAGKETKAHAGEFGSVENIRAVLDRLPITRLQHGNAVARDESLVDLVRERDITLDMCPVSNWKLRATSDWASHPLPRLVKAGVRCTVSTDDPLVIGNTVTDEYLAMAQFLGMSREEILQVARNGWMAATVPEELRKRSLEALQHSG
ncbi:MAG: adenosine deaminase [Opitutales bacterium]|nr:adenosine deaminase [Opitutales bacterium]